MGRRPILWRREAFMPKHIWGISPGFPELSPSKGHVTYVLLTRPPLEPKFPLDLHVLSPPLAFALSQDQTLQFNPLKNSNMCAVAHELSGDYCLLFKDRTRMSGCAID